MEFLIASKGRAVKNNFMTMLDSSEKVKLTLFVEPKEYSLYASIYKNADVIDIGANDMGLTFVRNKIYKFAINNEINYFWMPDDDIKDLFYRKGNRVYKHEDPIGALVDMEQQFISNKFAHAGLEYQQFAWSATKPFVLNSFVDAVVWFNMPILKKIIPFDTPYDERLKLKVDRDFCMKVILYGGVTARSTELSLSMPKEGSNTGGLKEIAYDVAGLEESAVDVLKSIWGEGVVEKIVKPSGRIDAKINWKAIGKPKQNTINDFLNFGL